MKQIQQPALNSLTILISMVIAVILLNVLFILLVRGEAKTIKLLKSELVTLEQEEQIIASAQNIYESYQNEIEVISQVFPNEETFVDFVQILETEVRASSDEYTLKFTASEPVQDKDKLRLPITITMKTDLVRLTGFLTQIEKLRYMTHVVQLSARTPDGFAQTGETSVNLVIYVQNPFTTQ